MDSSDDSVVIVFDLYSKYRADRLLIGLKSDGFYFFGRDFKVCTDFLSASMEVLNGAGMIPDHIVFAERFHQDQHVEGIGHGVERAPKMGSNGILIPESALECGAVDERLFR